MSKVYDSHTVDDQSIIDAYLIQLTRSDDSYLRTAARLLLRSHQPSVPESPPVCSGQMRADLL